MVSISKSIQHHGHDYILASSLLAEDRLRVLKHDDTFGVFDPFGDIAPGIKTEHGVYFHRTRHLSQLEIFVGGARPLLLASHVIDLEGGLVVDCANPELSLANGLVLKSGAIHLERRLVLANGVCYDKIMMTNYSEAELEVPIEYQFDADFKDIFEVRGIERKARGSRSPWDVDDMEMKLKYRGLDMVERRLVIEFDSPMQISSDGKAFQHFKIPPLGSISLTATYTFESDEQTRSRTTMDSAAELVRQTADASQGFSLIFDHDDVDLLFHRSQTDIAMLTTNTTLGRYPYAGVPWFSCPFGRDGLVTGMQLLWCDPSLAQGILRYLAHFQSTSEDPRKDAEPGKILHEQRNGEMANLEEIPFKNYYGSVDSTLLFVMLAGRYFQRTGDVDFLREIWPNLLQAIHWADRYGAIKTTNPYVYYQRKAKTGLKHQCWKDSDDSVFHKDGSEPEFPLALVEVQAYLFEARLWMARLADVFGEPTMASIQYEQAMHLRDRFNEDFWLEEEGTFALALDGKSRPCKVFSSNAGHALFAGICDQNRAKIQAATLMDERFFCGWGIRTIAQGEARYNPISYHNGSIWPHDNSIIGAGFARYGQTDLAASLLDAMIAVGCGIDHFRLPELLCGFARRTSGGKPCLFPLSCAPQAWAAGTPFLLLQSALGMEIDGLNGVVKLTRPYLPTEINQIEIKNLPIGSQKISLRILRDPCGTSVSLLSPSGGVRIIMEK